MKLEGRNGWGQGYVTIRLEVFLEELRVRCLEIELCMVCGART